MEKRNASGDRLVEQDLADRCQPFRCQHRICRRKSDQARRSKAAHLSHHDGGTTWKEIVSGLPDGPVNTVKEDPQRPGLLFAGTELNVFVSFNDGNSWQPLRLNMPATSIRDLVIHNDDVVVGTHGRSFWILDDITPLRQLQFRPKSTRSLICLRRKSLIA